MVSNTLRQIKSQWAQWHFLPCCEMSLQWKYFQITKTVTVKLFISLSTFALLTADPLVSLPVSVTSMSFPYFPPILPLPFLLTSLPPTTPPSSLFSHYLTDFTSFSPLSLFIITSTSHFCSVFSSIWSPLLTIPPSRSPLLSSPALSSLSSWAQWGVILLLSLSLWGSTSGTCWLD